MSNGVDLTHGISDTHRQGNYQGGVQAMTQAQIIEPAELATSEQRHWLEGYGQAVVHLAWLRDYQVRHLLFGMVELRPLELPAADSSHEQRHRAASKGGLYLYYRRFAMPVEEAIAWYEAAIEGNLALPASDDNPPQSSRTMQGGPFCTLPAWPRLVVSNKLDFAPDWMQGSRAHFLHTKCSLSQHELLRKPENSAQLKRWLHFDLVDLYQDYLGAICLIAPNPLFRSIKKSHLDEPRGGSVETVAYKLVARANQSLNGTRLEIVNENMLGRLTPVAAVFSDDTAIKVFEFAEEFDREGRTVTHPRHGLLCWNEPAPLIRAIQLDLAVESLRKSIEVPARGKRRPRSEYEVSEYQQESSTVIGTELDDSAIQIQIAEAQHRRARRQKGASQRWFHDKPEDAAKFIRDTIGSARRKVMIADPYFADRGLLAFGHAIRSPDARLKVLTSAAYLKNGVGSQVQKVLDQTFQTYPLTPKVRLLLGDPPLLHDRFLVVDDEVWLSGNSFNTIGERAGMVVRLPDPEPVIAHLKRLWKEATSLDAWLKKQSSNSQTRPGPPS